jgi:hypothetical protein
MKKPTIEQLLEAAETFELEAQMECDDVIAAEKAKKPELAEESRETAKRYILAADAMRRWAKEIR